MISVNNITKRFGDLEVLKGINLSIQKGEVVSIVGPSGVGYGKNTTLYPLLVSMHRAG